ncbi:MAG: hypothetical protein LBP57_05485 [Endomicrobium sp.]|nr:hypothetical protein [Endomicrobium sp.]
MKKIKIIASINNYDLIHFTTKELARLSNNKIDYFRLNLSKKNELNELFKKLLELENVFKDKLIIDIPYPREKSRLFFSPNEFEFIKNSCYIFNISSLKKSNYYIANFNGNIHLKKYDELVFGDGEGKFVFNKRIRDDMFEVIAKDNFKGFSGKAIHFGVSSSMHCNKENIVEYKKVINSIKPNMIAFSFVENSQELDNLRFLFNLENTKIISKIESNNGIDNIKDIVDKSDIILYGRGDARIYCSAFKLGINQKKIIDVARKNGKEIFVATGVLSSMKDGKLPQPSDIIDVTQMIVDKVNGVVFGADIKNMQLVLDLLHDIDREIIWQNK